MDQPGKVIKSTRVQLNRENEVSLLQMRIRGKHILLIVCTNVCNVYKCIQYFLYGYMYIHGR